MSANKGRGSRIFPDLAKIRGKERRRLGFIRPKTGEKEAGEVGLGKTRCIDSRAGKERWEKAKILRRADKVGWLGNFTFSIFIKCRAG